MSLGHGIILGGMQEREDNGDRRIHLESQKEEDKPAAWIGIKRAPGAHRIASHLREIGYDIEVIDYWQAWTEEELKQLLHQRLREDSIFVGISAVFPNGGAGTNDQMHAMKMYQIQRALKKEFGHKVDFIGGAQNISAIIGYDLDYYFAGFAEHAMTEYMKMKRGLEHDLVIRDRHYYHADRKVIECKHDHPAFPHPKARQRYEDRDFIRSDEVLSIELSRGCRFQCKFCSFSVLGVKGDYTRDADDVYEELLENYEKWGVSVYTITDETINDYTEKLEKFAAVVKRLPFKPHFQGFIRGDILATKPEQWQPLWDMGLWSHFYGIETYNKQAGKYVGKGMDPDKLKAGLIKCREWFQHPDRGLYKATIAMIIGLPGETRESFIEGFNWSLENMPNQSILFSPLTISQGENLNMMTNPSIFDKTAIQSGVFREATEESMGVNYDEIPESMQNIVKFYLNADGIKAWEHDTMNSWEAWKLFAELAPALIKLGRSVGPGIFYYHRYLTGGMNSIEDMTKTFPDGSGATGSQIEPYGLKHLETHLNIIKGYKEKKLALGAG